MRIIHTFKEEVQKGSRFKKLKYTKVKGCWEVVSHSLTPYGYAQVVRDMKYTLAHRHVYELTNGKIPDGQVIMHLCDNPKCINPNHLKAGTQRDNMIDKVSKGRAKTGKFNGEDNPNSKLTENDIRDIKKSELTGRELAKIYGVHYNTISAIKTGKKWTHIN